MHQIGVGVLGPVFRTYEPSEDRLVAVKAFHLDITPEQAKTLVDALTRVIEADLSHPGVVSPIDVGFEDGVPYMAQEYVAAESLDVAMRHYAPAPVETAMPLIRQIGGAIDAAHEQGVVHGALHLRDIFVTPDDVKITGFGVVKALEELRLAGPIRRPYTAPEVISGHPWGSEADLFALAAVAYELLTGRRAAGTGEQVTERLNAVVDVADGEALQAVFATALSDNPDDRYSSAARFVSSLESAIGQEGSGAAKILDSDAPPASAQPPLDLLAGLELHHDDDVLPSRADLASKRTAEPISPVDTDVDLTPTESLTANVNDDDNGDADDDADADEALAAQSEDQAEGKDDDKDEDQADDQAEELGEEAVDVHAIEAIETDAGSLDNEGLADELEPPSAPNDLFVADTREAPDAAAAAPSDESDEDDEAAEDDQAPVLVFPESLAAGPGLTAFVPGQDAEAEQEAEQEDEEVSHSDEGDEPPYVMPPDVVEPRSWAGRGAVPLVGVALVVAAVGYFVFLGLGSVEGPTDQVLGEQDAADVASLEFSEELVDGGQPGRVDDVDAPVVGAGAPPARPAPSPDPPPAAVSAPSASSSAPAAVPVSGSGWILVRTEPPGAVVTVDGEGRGTTPLSLQDVAYGEHEVAVGLQGFGSLSRTVTISPTETIATVGVTLTPERELAPQSDAVETALLEVESRPSGARVLLDGSLVGNTPMRLNVPIGRYQVRIEVDGYQAWSKTVAVTDDDEGNRVAASLERTR
jgi:serine/threonine protein kinase